MKVRPALLKAKADVAADAKPLDRPAVTSVEDGSARYSLLLGSLEVGSAKFSHAHGNDLVEVDLDHVVARRDGAQALVWKARAHQEMLHAPSADVAPKRRAPLALAACDAPADRVVISVVSGAGSWINSEVPDLLTQWLGAGYDVDWTHDADLAADADVCFYPPYGRIVPPPVLARHRHNLVVHESDLPRGRGCSPLTWQILAGGSNIPVTLFEAVEELDAGPVYAQRSISCNGHELISEMRRALTGVTFELCAWAVDHLNDLGEISRPQMGAGTSHPRRCPADSELDPHQSRSDQFGLLGVVDNRAYPAFFRLRGHAYQLEICDADAGTRSEMGAP